MAAMYVVFNSTSLNFKSFFKYAGKSNDLSLTVLIFTVPFQLLYHFSLQLSKAKVVHGNFTKPSAFASLLIVIFA